MGMMFETISLAVSCSSCGAAVALHDDEIAQVRCDSCGAELGAPAEVREQARAAVFDALRDDFHEVLNAAASVRASTPRVAA